MVYLDPNNPLPLEGGGAVEPKYPVVLTTPGLLDPPEPAVDDGGPVIIDGDQIRDAANQFFDNPEGQDAMNNLLNALGGQSAAPDVQTGGNGEPALTPIYVEQSLRDALQQQRNNAAGTDRVTNWEGWPRID